MGTLPTAPLFDALPAGDRAELAAILHPLRFDADQFVFRHGDPADAVYLVGEGLVVLFRDRVGRPQQRMGKVGAGELFGEMCLFGEEERTASARTLEPSVLYRGARGRFLDFLERHPELTVRLQIAAAQRRSTNAAAALELAQTGEVRIRVRGSATLELGDGQRRTVEVENLSLGGVCFTAAPDAWVPETPVSALLRLGPLELPVRGRVAWRRRDRVGLSFAAPADPEHQQRVHQMLRALAPE